MQFTRWETIKIFFGWYRSKCCNSKLTDGGGYSKLMCGKCLKFVCYLYI